MLIIDNSNGIFISNTTALQLAETVAALAVFTTFEIAAIVCGSILLLIMAVCGIYVYRKIHLGHQLEQPSTQRKLYIDVSINAFIWRLYSIFTNILK